MAVPDPKEPSVLTGSRSGFEHFPLEQERHVRHKSTWITTSKDKYKNVDGLAPKNVDTEQNLRVNLKTTKILTLTSLIINNSKIKSLEKNPDRYLEWVKSWNSKG